LPRTSITTSSSFSVARQSSRPNPLRASLDDTLSVIAVFLPESRTKVQGDAWKYTCLCVHTNVFGHACQCAPFAGKCRLAMYGRWWYTRREFVIVPNGRQVRIIFSFFGYYPQLWIRAVYCKMNYAALELFYQLLDNDS